VLLAVGYCTLVVLLTVKVATATRIDAPASPSDCRIGAGASVSRDFRNSTGSPRSGFGLNELSGGRRITLSPLKSAARERTSTSELESMKTGTRSRCQPSARETPPIAATDPPRGGTPSPAFCSN